MKNLKNATKGLWIVGIFAVLAIPTFATYRTSETTTRTTTVNTVPEFTENNPMATQNANKATNLMPVETDDLMYRNMTATWSRSRGRDFASVSDNRVHRTSDYDSNTYTTADGMRMERESVATTTVAANNTGRNRLDSRSDLTAQDQARGSKSEVELTRNIRRELVRDESLSTNAKNVKIITLNNVVTLRGPVNSEVEKIKVERTAGELAGNLQVDNQLEVVNR